MLCSTSCLDYCQPFPACFLQWTSKKPFVGSKSIFTKSVIVRDGLRPSPRQLLIRVTRLQFGGDQTGSLSWESLPELVVFSSTCVRLGASAMIKRHAHLIFVIRCRYTLFLPSRLCNNRSTSDRPAHMCSLVCRLSPMEATPSRPSSRTPSP